MGQLHDRWTTAKNKFNAERIVETDLLPDFLKLMKSGDKFGPALKDFEAADSFEKKESKFVTVVKTRDGFVTETAKSLAYAKRNKKEAAVAALTQFNDTLWAVFLEAKQAAAPPRPSGSMTNYAVLRGFNLSQGIKVKYLDIKATNVEILIELDSTLKKMIDDGRESLRLDHLGDVAMTELRAVQNDFVATIQGIEDKIETKLVGKPADRDAQIAEANAVLKYYARIVEDRVNKAIQDEWQKYLQRKQYLKDFRLKSVAKIVMGTVGIGVAAASLALSFGTAWMSILAIAKTIADMAQTIKTWSESMDKTYAQLIDDTNHVADLIYQREKAKKEKQGQKASKTKESAKELATALLPITKNILKSASSIEDRAKQFLGQTSKVEDSADSLVGQINKLIDAMGKLPDKLMSSEQKTLAKQMEDKADQLLTTVRQIHKESQNAANFGEKALKAAQKLRKEDDWTGVATANMSGRGAKAVAAYAAANFIYECCKHGKQLIPI